ncbi:hypothetical protein [Bradyrhizobium sp. OK095]|jgi:hypothetical protein|uniref:hypothetical protein n=1 Tax=Bradyrhizobium sp. OK095 TaxID=1882760 RepID=UPI0008B12AEC|nr:hypothetical protein [Bradyrhizobium sp. OK095]SEN99872.1 hypothetical protein SAMN05443254_115116 [Bradyrhizobium sp. OK095]
MSQIHKAFLGAVAITFALGAAQLASGHDLADRWQAVADKPGHDVNRSGKADRLAGIKPAAVPTRTVSMRLSELADTSVLLRVPAVIETGNAKPPALLQNQGRSRPTIACEPMVSSLTEVAKLLQPGRCVT